MTNTATNYDNLDYLLNIYHDLVYQKVPEKSYRLEPISRKNIKLIDLKKSDKFDYTDIFDAEFKYDGIRHDRLHFKRKSKTGYPCEVAFGNYKNSSPTNMTKGVLYDVAMMYMISEFVINENSNIPFFPSCCLMLNVKMSQKKYQIFTNT